MPNFPTQEQLAILQATDRVVLVSACPGSGKTSVFAEKVRILSKEWRHPRKGIAALSFTNTASREIFARVGNSLGPPHFIGTLDSFMLRYVVLPFGHYFDLPREGARLVPAPLDKRLKFSPFKYGHKAQQTVPIASVQIKGGNLTAPEMQLFDSASKSWKILTPEQAQKALIAKKSSWRSNGLITHSDCHFIAASLLADPDCGTLFSSVIAKRFPTLLVDEFQDTMWFLSKALLSLLRCNDISSIVVGDPDQSIYEFGGASSTLFEDVEALCGAKKYPMTVTQRFGPNICSVVSAISHSRAVLSSPRNHADGRTILITHELKDTEIGPLVSLKITDQFQLQGDAVVLVRNKRLSRRFSSAVGFEEFQGSSSLGKQFDAALYHLRTGESSQAANIVSRELWHLLTKEEGLPTRTDLSRLGIEQSEWRKLLYEILTVAHKSVDGDTWNSWLLRMKVATEGILLTLGKDEKLGALFRSDNKVGTTARNCVGPSAVDNNRQHVPVQTIHQAKGAQFDHVIVFFGKPHAKNSPCISSQWWSNTRVEEKRIGFVALSRPTKTIALCVHKQTLASLKAQQADFVDLFSETDSI